MRENAEANCGTFYRCPVLGAMDGYPWLVANAGVNHASHIREIRALPGFPAS